MTQARLKSTRALYSHVQRADLALAGERVPQHIGVEVPNVELVHAQSRVLTRLRAQGEALKGLLNG